MTGSVDVVAWAERLRAASRESREAGAAEREAFAAVHAAGGKLGEARRAAEAASQRRREAAAAFSRLAAEYHDEIQRLGEAAEGATP